jgi:hypothetical protein
MNEGNERGKLIFQEPTEVFNEYIVRYKSFGIFINGLCLFIIITVSIPLMITFSFWRIFIDGIILYSIFFIPANSYFFFYLFKTIKRFKIYENGFVPRHTPILYLLKFKECYVPFRSILNWRTVALRRESFKPIVFIFNLKDFIIRFELTLDDEKSQSRLIKIINDKKIPNLS